MPIDSPLLAGHRLIRRVHECERCRVLLARDESDGTVVVIKAFAEGVQDRAVSREVRAMETAASPHVVRLLDVSILADQPRCLILQRLGPMTLAAAVSDADQRDGRIATIACAAIAAVADMEERGVSRGRLSVDDFVLDAAGRPVVVGWSDVTFREEDCWSQAVMAEQRDLASLMGRLADMSEPGCGTVLAGIAASLGAPSVSPRRLRELADDVLDATEPEPLLVERPAPQSSPVTTAVRAIPVALPETTAIATTPSMPRIAALRDRVRTTLVGHRKRIVIAVIVAVISLVAFLFLVPERSSPSAGPTSVDPPAASDEPSHRLVADDGGDVVPADPGAAVIVLLNRRAECFSDASLLCLDRVDQDGSALSTVDRGLIGATDGVVPAVPSPGATAVVQERDGDVALVALSDATGVASVSVLVIRTDNGWRLRSVTPTGG